MLHFTHSIVRLLKLTGAYLRYWILRYGHLLLPLSACVLSFYSTRILIGPVLSRCGDDMYHLMNQYTMVHGAMAGDNILGPLGMEHGQPVLRFYQSLFYLWNVAVHFLTGLDMRIIHNLTTAVCFGLSPFTFYYFMRKLRLNRWTAGLASYMSLISVAAFGNSFEAFYQAGIVTQAMGGLLFPWFMGTYIGMLRGENSPVAAGTLFALAFLSHAIMAVYATFTGALYFFLSDSGVRGNIRKMAVFAVVGISLVAFWVFPFIHHNSTMRPVPDSVFRGSGVHWYTSVSSAELLEVAGRGYLLDDARATGNDRNEAEKLMDQINIIGTMSVRPPIFSILTGFGILCALFRLRRLSVRFLLGGFAFSLMLFAGPDDFRWTARLPFMDNVQAFRCTYLIELFAFGLAALGIEATIGELFTFARTRRRWWTRTPLMLLWLGSAGIVVGWIGREIITLGQTHVVIQDSDQLDMDLAALQNIPNHGYPFKVDARTGGRPKLRHAYFAMAGYKPFCTHWKGTGPETTFRLCAQYGTPGENNAFYALSGIRWISGWGPTMKSVDNVRDEDHLPSLRSIPSGTDTKGRDLSSRITLDTGFRQFLRPMVGSPVPVVCNDTQWLWLSNTWMGRYRNRLWSPQMPMILRVKPGELKNSGLLDRARAIFYFNHDDVDQDRQALSDFVANGGRVITPLAITDVDAHLLNEPDSPWNALPPEIDRARPTGVHPREDLDPGLETTRIEHRTPSKRTFQRFVFDVENIDPVIAVLPLQRYPGWKAYRNGMEVPVFSAGPDLIGIHLDPGVHRVKFMWEMPLRDRLFIVWSLLTAILVIGFQIRRRVKMALNERYVPTL